MSRSQKLVLMIVAMSAVFFVAGGRVEAAKTYTGESHSPTSYRPLCDAGTPVDFAAYPSNVNFNTTTGVMTYNINISWKRCNSTETRAYAIHGGAEVCPVSGIYGVGGWATDCVKYVGSPAYTGPGNGLTCWGGTNDQCVTTGFTGVRRAENQPSYTGDSISIPMSATNSLWGVTPDNPPSSWTISNTMCQYYKTGPNFDSPTHNDNRCITLEMTVSWKPTPVAPTVSCGTVTTSPSVPGPGENFSLTTNFTTNSGAWGGSDDPTLYSVRVSVPAAGIPSPGRYSAAFASIPWDSGSGSGTLPNSSIGGASALPISIASAGTHTVEYIVVVNGASNSPVTCTGSITVASKPYTRIYGGDVSVGKAAPQAGATSCSENSGAQILGWQRRIGLAYAGAGTQIAIFAINAIDQFASGQEWTPTNPKSLTFANAGNPTASSTYGGDLDSNNIPCAANYWQPTGSALPVTINPSTNGTFQSNGNTTINVNPAGIGTGNQVTIYVDGNAYINGNITYAPTNYANISDIPSFRLIVKGNIYVAPTVTELHGTFVAVDDGSNTRGKFYTCSGDIRAPTQAELETPCRWNFLTVYGSVIADTIKLNRTGGTLSNANVSDAYNHNTHMGAGTGPAERFIYTPESWLTSEFNTGGDAGSYKNQPPVL